MSSKRVNVRKLARAYVGLALAQDEARRYVSKHPADGELRPLVFSLNVTAKLLEELIEETLPAGEQIDTATMTHAEMLM